MDAPKFCIESVRPRRVRSKLMTVRISLARERDHPEGSSAHGYAFVAPLDHDGRLDVRLWARRRDECWVTRFSLDEPAAFGLLTHRRGGAGGATWAFEFDGTVDAGYRLDLHRFRSGDYVTVAHGGENHTYRVDAVQPYAPEQRMAPLAPPCPTAVTLRASLDRAVVR